MDLCRDAMISHLKQHILGPCTRWPALSPALRRDERLYVQTFLQLFAKNWFADLADSQFNEDLSHILAWTSNDLGNF